MECRRLLRAGVCGSRDESETRGQPPAAFAHHSESGVALTLATAVHMPVVGSDGGWKTRWAFGGELGASFQSGVPLTLATTVNGPVVDSGGGGGRVDVPSGAGGKMRNAGTLTLGTAAQMLERRAHALPCIRLSTGRGGG